MVLRAAIAGSGAGPIRIGLELFGGLSIILLSMAGLGYVALLAIERWHGVGMLFGATAFIAWSVFVGVLVRLYVTARRAQ